MHSLPHADLLHQHLHKAPQQTTTRLDIPFDGAPVLVQPRWVSLCIAVRSDDVPTAVGYVRA